MARNYTVNFENVAVTAAQDFFEILPATQKPIAMYGLFLSPAVSSGDWGDANEEVLRIRVVRGHTTSGSGGTAPTAVPMMPADTASGATCEVNNTTIASSGTAVYLLSDGFNIRTGYQLWLPEGAEFRVSNAELLCVRLMAAPSESISFSGTLFFREV